MNDLTGRKFGHLTVIKRDTTRLNEKDACWLCKCDCGDIKSVRSQHLRSGKTQNCGCKTAEMVRAAMESRGAAYKINHSCFESIDNEEQAYWFGFLAADGDISAQRKFKVSITQSKQDEQHLIKLRNMIYPNKDKPLYYSKVKYYYKNRRQIKNQAHLEISSPKIYKNLVDAGLTPRKSLSLTFPSINNHLYKHFIRGYFDGDGCITKSKLRNLLIYIAGTKEFLDSLNNIFTEILNTSLVKIGNKQNICTLQKSGQDAKKILDWLYKDSTVYLDRKYDLYNTIKEIPYNKNNSRVILDI